MLFRPISIRRAATVSALALFLCARAAALAPVAAAARRSPPAQRDSSSRSDSDAAAVAAFQARLEAYFALHRKAEATLPKLPKKATPEKKSTRTSARSGG